MRIVSSSLVLLVVASLAAADDPVPEACKLLTDGDNPLLASVSHLSGLTPAQLAKLQIDSLLAPIDAALPWLSKCVANVDLTQVVADLTTSPAVGQCLKTLEAEAAKAPQDDGFSDAYFHEVMCPTLKDTVVPCLNDVLVPELAKSLERAGSCCQDLGATVTAGLGAEIPQVVDTLSKLMVNTLCSVKSPTGDASTGETCGYSLVANLFGHGDDEATTLLNIAAAVQIPESSACDAANGREFHTTTGGVATFAGESDEQPFGVCYAAVQNLVEYVKGFPFWSSAFVHKAGGEALQPLSDLFSADTCVRGDALLQWALADDSYLLKLAVVADNLQSLFKMSPAESTESEPNSGTENEKKPETETEAEPTTEDDTETNTEIDTETDSEPKTETETNVETDPAAETAASSETETESKNETDHGTEAGVSDETETEPKNETETNPGEEAGVSDETETEPKTETDPTTEAEPNTETETDTTDETESETEIETETEDKDTTESETEGEGESESEPESRSETEPEPATEPNAEMATDETTNTEDVTETETDTETVEEAETEAEEKADAEEAAMDIIGDDDTTTSETGGDDYYDDSDIHIEVVDTAVPDIPDVPTLLDREDPVVAPEIATENAAAAALREALQEFVQPLALVCVHFPSATTCSFPDQQLEFAFGDVGHVPAGDQQ